MARLISTSVLLTLIVVLGIAFFRVIAPFLLPLFLAGVVTLLCQPLFHYFLDRTDGRVRLSAGLTTGCVLVPFLGLIVATLVASAQSFSIAVEVADRRGWTELLSAFEGETPAESPWQSVSQFANRYLPDRYQTNAEGVETTVRVKLRDAFDELGNRTLGIAGTTLDVLTAVLGRLTSVVLGFLIFVVALYYFFADGTALIRASERLIPVHVDYQRQLLNEFAKVVRSVVTATFMSALAQAVATVVALWLCGFEHLVILFVLTAIVSLIPLTGAWLVWGPCAVILAVGDHTMSAVLLSLYGIAFVGMLDNVVRTWVLNSDTKLHPLLAFISVMGGLQVLGLWGVFIGPIIASCLHALVKIFNHELVELSRERFSQSLAPVGPLPDGNREQEVEQSVTLGAADASEDGEADTGKKSQAPAPGADGDDGPHAPGGEATGDGKQAAHQASRRQKRGRSKSKRRR